MVTQTCRLALQKRAAQNNNVSCKKKDKWTYSNPAFKSLISFACCSTLAVDLVNCSWIALISLSCSFFLSRLWSVRFLWASFSSPVWDNNDTDLSGCFLVWNHARLIYYRHPGLYTFFDMRCIGKSTASRPHGHKMEDLQKLSTLTREVRYFQCCSVQLLLQLGVGVLGASHLVLHVGDLASETHHQLLHRDEVLRHVLGGVRPVRRLPALRPRNRRHRVRREERRIWLQPGTHFWKKDAKSCFSFGGSETRFWRLHTRKQSTAQQVH